MCQVLAEADVDGMIKQEEFATIFAVPQRTVSDWIGPIRARQKGSRDNLIYRLSFLGWTQQEIADSLGLTQQAVSAVTKNSDFAKICNGFKAGKSIDELAQFHGLEHIVVWRIILDSLSDMGRFEKFHEQKPSPFNVWMFAERDKRLGQIATGNIPGQIVTHLLYYYTQPNNLIVDPMAGGGSTIDACLMMGRKCRAYDLNPQRDDILKRDINNGFPTRAKNCDLIFLDPPYYNMVFDLYDDIDDFYAFVRRLAESCLETVRVDGHVAFLIQDMTEKGTYCLSGESYRIFIEAGFEYVDHISAPLTSNVEHYTRDEDERKLVGRNRDLYIFRRPGP